MDTASYSSLKQSRPGVIQRDKGDRSFDDDKICIGIVHYVCFDVAEEAVKDKVFCAVENDGKSGGKGENKFKAVLRNHRLSSDCGSRNDRRPRLHR